MKKNLFFVSLAVALITAGVTVGVMFALGVVDVDDDEYDKGSRYGLLTLEHGDKADVPFQEPRLRGFKGRQYAKPDVPSFRSGPNIFILPFGRGQFRERSFPEGPPPFFGMDPDGPSFRSGPRTFILPFGREQFREGPFQDGPPPFFGIDPQEPGSWFGQDGEFLSPGGEICVFLEDVLGEWGDEICDDDYYGYDDDGRDDDKDGDGHDNDDGDYD